MTFFILVVQSDLFVSNIYNLCIEFSHSPNIFSYYSFFLCFIDWSNSGVKYIASVEYV